jgi:hypothetical protein
MILALSVIMLNAHILSVVLFDMLNVIMLIVGMLSAVAPCQVIS